MTSDNTNTAPSVMKRIDVVKRLVSKLNRAEAVVGGIGFSNFDLWASGQRPENFYMLGSMGLAIPIALGVALAQPERTVFALEGDGSLLMQLGCLGTVATLKPKNLHIVVFDNGSYQITGGQAAATRAAVDLVAVARASGLANSDWARDLAHLDSLIGLRLDFGGPSLIGTKVAPGPATGVTDRNPTRIKERFMAGIGVTA